MYYTTAPDQPHACVVTTQAFTCSRSFCARASTCSGQQCAYAYAWRAQQLVGMKMKIELLPGFVQATLTAKQLQG